MRCVAKAVGSVVERLETRTLMSGSPLAVSQVPVGNGLELQIRGTAKTNQITLKQTDAGLLASDNGFSQTVSGVFTDIKLFGGAGNDSIVVDASVTTNCFLYGGAGRNVLQAGSGNDTLVSIGSTADTLVGGAGNDSFWADAKPSEKISGLTADEVAGGNVHRVSAFYTGPTAIKSKLGAKAKAASSLLQPATTDGSVYQNFSDHPLFGAAGPSENDIVQGQIGDCFFLSVLSSVAKIDPNRIRQSILDMGDGTYVVQLSRGSTASFVHVDGELPVNGYGVLDYAGLGAGGSTWVALMEKAFAAFRGTSVSYAAIDGGWMSDAYTALGCSSTSFYGGTGATDLLAKVETALAAGKSVTYGTNQVTDGAPLIAGHAYTVDSIVTDTHGVVTGLRLRNPWGIDGAGNDGRNDGYVTVTAQQLNDCLSGITSAYV